MTGAFARRLGLGLCLTLGLCTLMVLLDRARDETEPTITSAKPSGVRLFSELLEQSGLDVELNRNRWPRLAERQVAVAFVRTNQEGIEWPDGGEGTRATFTELVANGQTLIAFYVPEDFNAASASASTLMEAQNELRPDEKPLKVSGAPFLSAEEVGDYFLSRATMDSPRSEPLGVWTQDGQASVYYESLGKGVIVHVTNGVGATNRFIDRGDNAKFFVSLVKSLAGGKGEVVFTEAAQGNVVDESLFSGLGGWARATAWQLFALFLVVAWTSGVAFGLPIRDRRRQAGTRDLMEAFGSLMRRRRAPQFALTLVINAIKRDLKRSVGLPAAATEEALLARLPDGLAQRLLGVSASAAIHTKYLPLEDLEQLRREAREFRNMRQNRIVEPAESLQQES